MYDYRIRDNLHRSFCFLTGTDNRFSLISISEKVGIDPITYLITIIIVFVPLLLRPLCQNRHQRTIQVFARRHRKLLNRKLSAFFSISGVAASQRPEDHVVARKAVARLCVATGWYPPQVAIIAGAIPYTRYTPLTRLLMRWFMARQGSDTDTRRDYVYTDWAAVTAFADRVVRELDAVPPGGPPHI